MAGQSPSPQLSRVRELVADDFAARLEIGELLLEAVPWPADGDDAARAAADRAVAALAAEAGLSTAQARRYRTVARKIKPYRSRLAETGVAISYAAASAALLRSSGSAELLLAVCRETAASGRSRVTTTDVETARRTAARAQMEERRRARTTERAQRAEQERDERRAALAPYQEGIDALVTARLSDVPDEQATAGTADDRDAAESTVVRELAERIVDQGGNPSDLLELGSEVIDRQAHVVKAVRKSAGERNAVNRKLNSAETMLQRLAGDTGLRAGSEQALEQWLASLDRIITHAVDLAERLKDRDDGAQ
jgi:hypothetical protein